jgi:hypothetical protein
MSQFKIQNSKFKIKVALIFNFAFLILNSFCFAQQNKIEDAPQMADTFRSEGKIYVVVLVLSIVFVCLATYLIIIDRKLKKLEDKVK